MGRDEITEIIREYCTRITKVLLSQDAIKQPTQKDCDLFDRISQMHIERTLKFDETYRIEMENFLYYQCNEYARSKIQFARASDVGDGIDRIERYLRLMGDYLNVKYDCELPLIVIHIKNIIRIRLETIGLTNIIDQSILLHSGKLRNEIMQHKYDMEKTQRELSNSIKEIGRELKNVDRRKTDIYKDIIAIISIFSGVILTFAGTFSFSSVILENLNSANFPKVITAVVIIFLFLLTLFIGLFWFSYGIVYEKPIYSTQDAKPEERKKIKRHRLLLLVPLLLAYVVAIVLALTMIIKFPNQLLEGASDSKYAQPTATTVHEETTGIIEEAEIS